jgi:hypothetical protein
MAMLDQQKCSVIQFCMQEVQVNLRDKLDREAYCLDWSS